TGRPSTCPAARPSTASAGTMAPRARPLSLADPKRRNERLKSPRRAPSQRGGDMDPQEAKPNGTPALDRSWAFRRTAAVAVAAIAVGIGLAVWSGQSTRVVRVVVAVRPNGRGSLFVTNLAPAPPGKTYEAWVISNGSVRPAG